MSKSATISRDELKNYYKDSDAWDQEVHVSLRSKLRISLACNALSLALATAAVGAVIMMAPLKTVVPYIITVDAHTGIAQPQQIVDEGPLTQSEVLQKFFIKRYIIQRLAYVRGRATTDYEAVQYQTEGREKAAHHKEYEPGNPESYLARMGDDGIVTIDFKSTSFVDNDTVTVRIKRSERQFSQIEDFHEVVTVTFKYTQVPTDETIREYNPLGFLVTAFRVDPEAGNAK